MTDQPTLSLATASEGDDQWNLAVDAPRAYLEYALSVVNGSALKLGGVASLRLATWPPAVA